MHCIIMGAPGAGKGTYADGIVDHYGIPHISTGDIFRDAMRKETPMGLIAKSYIDKGHLVPDEITNSIVAERLKEDDCVNGFLLDGYPRNINQAIALDKTLKEMAKELDVVINLDVDDNVIINRIVNRRICPSCGRSYNLLTLKPKKDGHCDNCDVELYQRKDDNEETIKSRLEVYNTQTKPLIEYYNKQDNLLNVNGEGEAKEVTRRILEALDKR